MEKFVERSFTSEQRKKLAKSGAALPDGSFPIENEGDLKNAVQAIGRASNPATAKAHIKKRAKALGCTDCIPDTWESWQAVGTGELVSEATYTHGDSHDGLRDKLGKAIDGKVMSGEDMDGDDDGEKDAADRKQQDYPSTYVRAVHDKHVIYSMNGKTMAHKYDTDEEGDPHLKGKPVEVEPSYTTVDNSNESFNECYQLGMQETIVDGKKMQVFSESAYDSAKGEITVTVIKPGWSKNNRYYPADLLKQRANVFEGAKMFVDHATPLQENQRPEGSIKDWVANLGKPFVEADGTVRAPATIIDPAFKSKVALLAEKGMLNTLGVSIRAFGESKSGTAEGKQGTIVENIIGAKSVDFVTFAGAGGKVETLN